MYIHGIVSTYFGDLEYDIGRSLNWTSSFCDTTYIMDLNIADTSRQFVIDWDRYDPDAKYSFFSQHPFFGSPQNASDWRKTSFDRALSAWNYSDDDWVLFVDGTEGLNVFHKPPEDLVVVSVEVDGDTETVTLYTEDPHTLEVGYRVYITGSFLNIPEVAGVSPEYNLSFDGDYRVDAVGEDYFTIVGLINYPHVDITNFEDPLTIQFTTEPKGFHDGLIFQSWFFAEIRAAIDAGVDLISLDSWAMIRSSSPEEILMQIRTFADQPNVGANPNMIIDEETGERFTKVTKTSEYYVPMGNMIRLARVGALKDEDFDWSMLDQPTSDEDPFPNSKQAEYLSLVSYAYMRWSETPDSMTQAVDPDAPNYVAGDALEPAFRPVSIESDVGFVMRRLISTVRPIDGIPLDWSLDDPDGEQPLVDGIEKLETVMVPFYSVQNGVSVFEGYQKYGGSPLYPGVIRANRREGVWYRTTGPAPLFASISSVSFLDGVITVTTTKRHYMEAGTKVVISGVNVSFPSISNGYGLFEGTYTIDSVPDSTSFTVLKTVNESFSVSTTPTPFGKATTLPPTFGILPWDYMLHQFQVTDPVAWIKNPGDTSPFN